MKNVYEVLQQKQRELEQARVIVDALRLVAPLLADEDPVPGTFFAPSPVPGTENASS